MYQGFWNACNAWFDLDTLTTMSLFISSSFQYIRLDFNGYFFFSADHFDLIILIQVDIFGGAWRGLRSWVIMWQALDLSLGNLWLI